MPKSLYDALARLAAKWGYKTPALVLSARKERPKPVLYWSRDQ